MGVHEKTFIYMKKQLFILSQFCVILAIFNVWACFTNFYDKTTSGVVSLIGICLVIWINFKRE